MKNYLITIYSGNKGGFENQGQSVSFQTEIPGFFFFPFFIHFIFLFLKIFFGCTLVPSSLNAAEIGSNWIYLSWEPNELAFNYLIEVKHSVKRNSELISCDTTNYNITNLLPSTE